MPKTICWFNVYGLSFQRGDFGVYKVTHAIAFSPQLPSHATDCQPQNSFASFLKDLLRLQRFSLVTYFSSFFLFQQTKEICDCISCITFYKMLDQQCFSFPLYSSEGSPFPSNILLFNWTINFIKCFEKWLRIVNHQLAVGSGYIYYIYCIYNIIYM